MTRSLELCDTVDCQGKFEVKCLESDEAWSLFKKTLDHGITLSVEVEKIAKLVAKECASLPLGIITVARSMRGATDIPEWRNALDQLTTLSIGYKKMEDRVFRILEWSFNHLNRYERLCFLYCCLYPEDWEIEREELINLFSLAELVPRRETRESKFDHGHTILNKLIKACLLEESETHNGKECVKMHDLIRDMALRITCGKSISKITGDVPKFFMKNRSRKLILEKSEWTQDLNAVSFIRVGLLEIQPGLSPICPKLSTLFLHHAKLKRIPDLFFKHIDELKFLNLTCCDGLKELPSYISDMVNLNALSLANCREFESIPPLGKLKLLRKLDLSNTRITDVPQGLEELVRLEYLYMLKTRLRNKIVPKGTFSKLKHLQHLELPAHINDLEVLKQLQLFRGPTLTDVHRLISSSYQPKHYDIVIVEIPCFDFEICFSDINDVRNLMFKGFNFQKGLDMVLPPEGIRKLILDNCFRISNDFFQHLINRSKQLSYLRMRHLDEIQFLLNLSSPLLSIPQDAALATTDFVTPYNVLKTCNSIICQIWSDL